MFCGVTSGAILFACHVKSTLGLYKLSRMMGLGRAFNHNNDAMLSMKFQLLINVEIAKISGKFWFKTQKLVIFPAHK